MLVVQTETIVFFCNKIKFASVVLIFDSRLMVALPILHSASKGGIF